jgi:hypothetical protein
MKEIIKSGNLGLLIYCCIKELIRAKREKTCKIYSAYLVLNLKMYHPKSELGSTHINLFVSWSSEFPEIYSSMLRPLKMCVRSNGLCN